ncbi:hypothetical protein I4U23_004172 [Adineta vaga]|nr:hypothetical protein I4U23_004172 [Adineta vaga]
MNFVGMSVLLLLSFIPVASSLACFSCWTGWGTYCGDPFIMTSSSLGSGVFVTTGCSYSCVKSVSNFVVYRYCGSCPGETPFVNGSGVACCSDRDYCNGASTFQNISIIQLCLITLVLISVMVLFKKI